MERPAKKEVSPGSPEAEGIVHDAIQSGLIKIGGIEMLFSKAEISEKDFSRVNHKAWAEFLSDVFTTCNEHNLRNPFQISMDKENHKVLGVIFLGPNAKEILVPYSE